MVSARRIAPTARCHRVSTRRVDGGTGDRKGLSVVCASFTDSKDRTPHSRVERPWEKTGGKVAFIGADTESGQGLALQLIASSKSQVQWGYQQLRIWACTSRHLAYITPHLQPNQSRIKTLRHYWKLDVL